jgi:hypothetical protein
VGLRKIRKKMFIRLPPQDYHLRKSKGRTPRLPDSSDVPQKHTIHDSTIKPNKIPPEDSIPVIAFERQAVNRIAVPASVLFLKLES